MCVVCDGWYGPSFSKTRRSDPISFYSSYYNSIYGPKASKFDYM